MSWRSISKIAVGWRELRVLKGLLYVSIRILGILLVMPTFSSTRSKAQRNQNYWTTVSSKDDNSLCLTNARIFEDMARDSEVEEELGEEVHHLRLIRTILEAAWWVEEVYQTQPSSWWWRLCNLWWWWQPSLLWCKVDIREAGARIVEAVTTEVLISGEALAEQEAEDNTRGREAVSLQDLIINRTKAMKKKQTTENENNTIYVHKICL